MDELLIKSENSMEENNDEPWMPKRAKRGYGSSEWTEEDVIKLISFVEAREILWHPTYPNYHNKPLRCNVWQEISECLESKFTVEEIIAKWTNLRIQFRGYVARSKPNKWRYFQALQFLKKVEVNKRSSRMSRATMVAKAEERAENALNGEIIGYSTPNTSRSSRSQSPITVPSSSVAVEMQEPPPVRMYKCRSDVLPDRNLAFTRYLCSELQAMPEDDASFVRNTMNRQLLDCLQQLGIRKQQQQQQHHQHQLHQHQPPPQQHHPPPPPPSVQNQQYVQPPSFSDMLGPTHL